MKIKNKYRFIDIKARDSGIFTDIALLVDRLDFISEIEQTRSKYGELNYAYPLSKTDAETVSNNFEYKMFKDKQLKERFDSDVERIRKLFKRPPHFREIIAASIMYGRVINYSKAYMEKQEITPTEDPDDIPDIKYCIVIHSGTRLQDIEKVFNKFKEEVRINFKASEEEKKKYNFGYWFDFSLTRPMDTKDSIRALRTLYQLRKNEMSPLKITLKDLKISKKQYNEALQNCRVHEKRKDEEYDRCLRLVDRVEKRRDSIKSLIKRYSDLLLLSNTIL
jgi:hypothetical protein